MKCPQCGSEFEGVVEQCFTCGWEFDQKPEDFKPRTSKLAVLTLILGILCLVTFYLPLLAAIVVGVVALRKIRKSRGRLTGERLAITGILIPVLSLPIIPVIGYAVWSKDAGPVPNEFTEADLVQVRPENEVSWKLLLQLNDEPDDPNGAPAIGLTKQDIEQLDNLYQDDPNSIEARFKFIREHVAEIKSLWTNSRKGREIFEKLAEFDEIADLEKAVDLTSADVKTDYIFIKDARYLACIYTSKCLLLQQEGRDIEAVQTLIFFDSVVRKYDITARSLISKLVGYAMLSVDIHTADYLANSSSISDEALALLKSHFMPLTPNLMCLRNCIVYEYLSYKNSLQGILAKERKTTMLKFNSSCRYFDCYCRKIIKMDEVVPTDDYCPISVWPWDKPNWPRVSLDEEDIESFNIYTLYNPIGWMMTQILFPAYGKIIEIKTKVYITDDLFQWVLARRLGEKGSLKARAYSDEYTVDVEKGLVFSVGPDGQAYTDDDIKLPIDPAVLGLK